MSQTADLIRILPDFLRMLNVVSFPAACDILCSITSGLWMTLHCSLLANTVERLRAAYMSRSATNSGDAASSQITLDNLVIIVFVYSKNF